MGPYSQHLPKYKLTHVNWCGKGNKNPEAKGEAGFVKMFIFHYLSYSLPLFCWTRVSKTAHTKCESVFGIRLSDMTSKQKERRKNSLSACNAM